MKKGKNRSEISLQKTLSTEVQEKEEIVVPLDVLHVKILNLTTYDDVPRKYTVKATFFDQIIVTDVIQSVGSKENVRKKAIAEGIMSYDPSDYDRMSILADYPLSVSIHPIDTPIASPSTEPSCIDEGQNRAYVEEVSQSTDKSKTNIDVYCCNVDILILFIGQKKIVTTQRMEPHITPTVLSAKSWNNLPKILMDISVIRNKANSIHHAILREANVMKITLTGAYNMIIPYDTTVVYTAATKIAMNMTNEMNYRNITFNEGYRIPKHFNNASYYPKWESLRLDQIFTKCDEKFEYNIEEVTNEQNLDLQYYWKNMPEYSTIWGSFHRSLMLNNSEKMLLQQIRQYKWPFEVHIYNEYGGYSFMAFLDLFRLLYPGETVLRIAIPLQWINAESMLINCGCDLLLAPKDKTSSIQGTTKKPSKATTDSAPTSTSTEVGFPRPTEGDQRNAFIIVEVKLAKPLREPAVPPHISMTEINRMLIEMEEKQVKRECTGRGQLNRDWQSTTKSAANSLRRIPYYGMTDISAVNRQLSETRNRVEMVTSFWQDAATNVNNNFVIQNFLGNDDLYEEMLMMSHACLMRTASDCLVGLDKFHELDSVLRSARHARQLKDIPHAVDLLLQLIAEKPRDANVWRELATCLKEMDIDWAIVCLNKSITLNLRHPLTLLSKACMVFEDDPDAAEPFFVGLMALYPFWIPMWVAVSAYYLHKQMFLMAQEIMECVEKTTAEGFEEEYKFPRNWETELGDWWDHTPLLPGCNLYYESADLLLRIRALSLAEVCIARAFCQSGETTAYYHLVALCCRLRRNPADALCHLKIAIAKFGDINYLRSLEAECHHKLKNIPASIESFEKAGTCTSAYSILLSLSRRDTKRMRSLLIDFIRRQPNAYAWMALADDWMMRSASGDCDPSRSEDQSSAATLAAACAVQALKWDRSAGRAWALLAMLVKPNARRLYCRSMATAIIFRVSFIQILFYYILLCSLTVINIPQGRVSGIRNYNDNFTAYLGIPYATVKERFQDPGQPPCWNKTFHAVHEPPSCEQTDRSTFKPTGIQDCLVLNVFTPLNLHKQPLPVLIVIPGGGFHFGLNAHATLHPKYLMHKNIIVVIIRLGAFGFLCLQTPEIPGNAGLKDQVAAIRWVKNNILYFGGDPHSITLFGHSVAATSVSYLLLSPETNGLFQHVIISSGSLLVPYALDNDPVGTASRIASRMGYITNDPNQLLKIYQNASSEAILKASHFDDINDPLSLYVFRPCIDKSERSLVKGKPRDIIKSTLIERNVSIVIGYANMEGIKWAERYNQEGLKNLDKLFSKIIPYNIIFASEEEKSTFVAEVRDFYFKNHSLDSYEPLIDYFSDSIIVYPLVATTKYLLRTNITMYNYYFQYDSERNIFKRKTTLARISGASHGDELGYAFYSSALRTNSVMPADAEVINALTSFWSNVAKTGNPSTKEIEWRTSKQDDLKFLSIDKKIKMIPLPNEERIKFWERIYEKYNSY